MSECARPRRSSSASCVACTARWWSLRSRIGVWRSLQPASYSRSRCLPSACWASNSCRTSRKATSGFAQPCRLRFRSKRETTSSTACGWSETVVSQQGRPDDGTDATGFFNAAVFAPLKPAKEWRTGMTKDKLIEEVNEALEAKFPGVNFNFSQYIQDNVEEAVSGVKGENSVKLIGNDIVVLTETADKIKAAMSKVRGVADLAVFTSLGQPTLRIDIDRKAAARYGLAPGDINSAVQTAVGGQAAGDLYEEGSDRHFPLVVRLAPKYRQNIETISSLTIAVQDPTTNKVAQ